MDDTSNSLRDRALSRSESRDNQDFSSFFYDEVSNDSLFDGLEDSYGSDSDVAGNHVPLSTPFFDVGGAIEVAKFNRFRKNYRSFRTGTAKGAKGEIGQFVTESDKNSRSFSVVPPFLEKLYDMLSEKNLQNYISWCDDGTTIFVKKVDEFSKLVLPRYFKHDKFASFLRQLNMYNFYTTRQEPNMRQFSNPLFRRDGKDCIRNIKRKRGTSKKSTVSSGKVVSSLGADNTSSRGGGYSDTASGKQRKKSKRQKLSKAIEDVSKPNRIGSTSGRVQSSGARRSKKSNLFLNTGSAQAVSVKESNPSESSDVRRGIIDGAVDTHLDYDENAKGSRISMEDQTFENQRQNMNRQQNFFRAKDLDQIKQNLASTIEANKILNDEVITLRKEVSRNKNQIKGQQQLIKTLEGNLKSIIATYSTMNETLILLQEELVTRNAIQKES